MKFYGQPPTKHSAVLNYAQFTPFCTGIFNVQASQEGFHGVKVSSAPGCAGVSCVFFQGHPKKENSQTNLEINRDSTAAEHAFELLFIKAFFAQYTTVPLCP